MTKVTRVYVAYTSILLFIIEGSQTKTGANAEAMEERSLLAAPPPPVPHTHPLACSAALFIAPLPGGPAHSELGIHQ